MALLERMSQRSTRKQMGCSNNFTRQSNKRWRLKQGSEDPCDINTSALRSLIRTLLITQALAVKKAEFLIDAFFVIPSILNWEFVHSKHPCPLRNLPKMFLRKRRWSTKMFAEMLCRLTSKIKLIMIRRLTLHSSRKQITCMICSRKQTIKGAKFHLQVFGGLAPTFFKRCSPIWHKQDASASLHAIASVHTQTIPTWYTDHASRMENWLGSEH